MSAVVNALSGQWHKLLACTMHQQGMDRVTLTPKDVAAIQDWVIVAHDHHEGLEIRLFESAEKAKQYTDLVDAKPEGRA